MLVDIRMPVVGGIEATRRIAADTALAGVHVVILADLRGPRVRPPGEVSSPRGKPERLRMSGKS
ncbi:hypothetical protein GCM10010307_01110 [Streptomyces vastus]|uniref:Response regulatory domain-containing protein n=1 Tax=Streptomyces vastus TaxID=285451 RepID=A0ABN3Q737_9ACTN